MAFSPDVDPRRASKLNVVRSNGLGEVGAWLGPEARSLEQVIIPPRFPGRVTIGLADLDVPPEYLAGLTISGRSRLAQLGLEVPHQAGTQIAMALTDRARPDTVTIPVRNHSDAPVVIPPDAVGRLINRHGPDLTGDEIRERIGSEIELTGREGKHWWIEKDGLVMLLEPDEQWIPPRDTPVIANGATGDTFRRELDEALHPIRHGDWAKVRIGQTEAELRVSGDLYGFIDPTTTETAVPHVRIANANHLNAPSLQSGYPQWKIRTETLSTPMEGAFDPVELPRKALIATFAIVKP